MLNFNRSLDTRVKSWWNVLSVSPLFGRSGLGSRKAPSTFHRGFFNLSGLLPLSSLSFFVIVRWSVLVPRFVWGSLGHPTASLNGEWRHVSQGQVLWQHEARNEAVKRVKRESSALPPWKGVVVVKPHSLTNQAPALGNYKACRNCRSALNGLVRFLR